MKNEGMKKWRNQQMKTCMDWLMNEWINEWNGMTEHEWINK